MFDIKSLYGLPLKMADQFIRERGFEPCVKEYVSKRGPAGKDARVISAKLKGNRVYLVIGFFKTNIEQEKNEQD